MPIFTTGCPYLLWKWTPGCLYSRKYRHWYAYFHVKIGIQDAYTWGCRYLLDTCQVSTLINTRARDLLPILFRVIYLWHNYTLATRILWTPMNISTHSAINFKSRYWCLVSQFYGTRVMIIFHCKLFKQWQLTRPICILIYWMLVLKRSRVCWVIPSWMDSEFGLLGSPLQLASMWVSLPT